MLILETVLLSIIMGAMIYEAYRCISFRRPVENIVIPVHHIVSYDPSIIGLYLYSVNLDEVAPLTEHRYQKENCPICFEDVERIRTTRCRHRFCDGCLSHWIKKSTRCPLCNQDMISSVQ